RNTVATYVQDVLNRINQLMAGQTSVANITKWRIKSLFSGASYAEIALRESIEYRVQQVYLLEGKTGLLVHHLSNANVKQDPDAVSAMLVALEDFLQDSFSSQTDHLESAKIGQQLVWLFTIENMVLACVIDGNPPSSLRSMVLEQFESLYYQNQNDLSAFDGDRSELSTKVEPFLQPIIAIEKLKNKPVSKLPGYIAVAALSVLLISYFGYAYWSKQQLYSFIEQVDAKPGWQLLSYDIQGPTLYNWTTVLEAKFLKDPIAEPEQQLVEQAMPERFRERAQITTIDFISLDPTVVNQRLKNKGFSLKSTADKTQITVQTEQELALAQSLIAGVQASYDITLEPAWQGLTEFNLAFESGAALTASAEQSFEQWLQAITPFCESSSCQMLLTPHSDGVADRLGNQQVRKARYAAIAEQITAQLPLTTTLYHDAYITDDLSDELAKRDILIQWVNHD
ncbi:MAG: hypothetical protein SVC26_03585, partial [Pseudomonadota bacterium]|nr:hypothetical protein [Pseudomonadota bacterium]